MWQCGGVAPLISNLSGTWTRGVSFMLQLLYHCVTELLLTMEWEARWAQTWWGAGREETLASTGN